MPNLWKCAAGVAILAAAAFAQTTTSLLYQQTMTTGMAGLAPAQTARLTVLNLSTGTSAAQTCNVQLAFYDEKNAILKQASINALAPQTAAALELSRSEVNAASQATRVQLRGVVRSGPGTASATVSLATPGVSVIVASSCSVMTTLEIYDIASGITRVFSSDTRSSSSGIVLPLTTPQ